MISFEEQQRVLHSKFDIATHKDTFISYLEVCIDPEGVIHYAVPSHQEWLINYICNKYDIQRKTLLASCPEEYSFDVMSWLCKESNCVAVWETSTIGHFNKPQYESLCKLISAKLYSGNVPKETN